MIHMNHVCMQSKGWSWAKTGQFYLEEFLHTESRENLFGYVIMIASLTQWRYT